jgi:tetratricopeptide (TPR) repeat protein
LEPALFHAGRLAALSERPDEAAGHWQRQLAEMPGGIYAGICHVELSKLRLEHFFDLAGADVQLKDGLAWYEAAQRQAGLGEVAAAVPSLPSDWPADPLVRPARDVGYDLLLQGGLVAYLSGRRDEAVELFRKARPLASTVAASAHRHEPASGLGRLLAAAEANQELVPQEVLDGDDKAKVCLQLAACYYAAEDFPRVLELTERAMERLPRIKPHQRAWARFLHGRACHALWMPLDGLDDFSRAVAEAPGASWAPQCQFFVANSTFSYAKDVSAAIAAWKHLVNRYPQSDLVERASYHIGFAYQAAGQYRQARDSYDAFMEKYPTSPFTKAIEQHHLPEIEAVTLSPSP